MGYVLCLCFALLNLFFLDESFVEYEAVPSKGDYLW